MVKKKKLTLTEKALMILCFLGLQILFVLMMIMVIITFELFLFRVFTMLVSVLGVYLGGRYFFKHMKERT